MDSFILDIINESIVETNLNHSWGCVILPVSATVADKHSLKVGFELLVSSVGFVPLDDLLGKSGDVDASVGFT